MELDRGSRSALWNMTLACGLWKQTLAAAIACKYIICLYMVCGGGYLGVEPVLYVSP